MNRKQLILLLAALVVAGGASLLLLNRHQESWNESEAQLGGKLLKNFQINDVAAISIKGGTNLDLVRKNDRWRVAERGDYPANFSQISDLLIKVGDLKIVQSEPIGPAQLGRMHLEPPGKSPGAGVLVEFKNSQGNVLDSILLGKKHTEKSERPSPMSFGEDGFADGRYVMLMSDPKNMLTVSDPLNSVDPKAAEWLNKDFFKIENPQSISFVSTNASNSWTLTRASESAPWVLNESKPGEVLDTNKLSSLASTLSYPSFVDVAADPANAGMDKPLRITLKTFDGFTYSLKVGSKTPENDYNLNVEVTADLPSARTGGKDEKPEDKKKLDKEFQDKNKQLQDKLAQEKSLSQWTYVVNGWLIDPLIRDRAQLMVEKKIEKPAGAESKSDTVPPDSTLQDSIPDASRQ